ncbi:hypothetical protein PIN17_A1431 [Prevotella intermedia 17]|nr:hypothetical protein PIN17_A1431 [Prevotella intermedia 17]
MRLSQILSRRGLQKGGVPKEFHLLFVGKGIPAKFNKVFNKKELCSLEL